MTKTAAYVRAAFFSSLGLLNAEARAQVEGTLFTSPDEREYLDYLREEFLRTSAAADFNIEDVEIPEIPQETPEEAAGPVEYSFGGVMARREGVRVWLNGNLLAESELPEGFSVVKNDSSFSLRVAQNGETFILLPGQTVDVTAGTVVESFQRASQPVIDGTQPATTSTTGAAEEQAEAADPADVAQSTAAEAAPPGADESTDDAEAVPNSEAGMAERVALIAEALAELQPEEADNLLEALQQMQEERPEEEDAP